MASFDFVPLTLHYAQDERWERPAAKYPATVRTVGEAIRKYSTTVRTVGEAVREDSHNRSS